MEEKELLALMSAIIASQMIKDMEPSDEGSRNFVIEESVTLAARLLKVSEIAASR